MNICCQMARPKRRDRTASITKQTSAFACSGAAVTRSVIHTPALSKIMQGREHHPHALGLSFFEQKPRAEGSWGAVNLQM